MRTARPTIRPRWARWPRPGRASGRRGLHRPGRRGHHQCRARFGRLRQPFMFPTACSARRSRTTSPPRPRARSVSIRAPTATASPSSTRRALRRLQPQERVLARIYDAAALILLAMQAAGRPIRRSTRTRCSTSRTRRRADPAGELAKAIEILAAGGDIDYVGASAVELIGPGESAGSYREFEMKGGKIETVRFR